MSPRLLSTARSWACRSVSRPSRPTLEVRIGAGALVRPDTSGQAAMSTEATGSSPPSFAHDLRDAVMWLVATVPAAFGFWVIAGELAGVQSGIVPSCSVRRWLRWVLRLVQVVAGYRLPLFEGPAGSYLAAIAVLAAGSEPVTPAQITGDCWLPPGS